MATTLPSNRRDALAQWWQLRTRSERMLLATAAGIAALALAWLVMWQPLAHDTDRLGRQIENDRAALADARRRADEIAGLARNAPSVAPAEPRAALDAALARKGWVRRTRSCSSSIRAAWRFIGTRPYPTMSMNRICAGS